jgi:hypothetical protein
MEITQNPQEINFGSNDELNNQPFLNPDNLITTLNVPNITETNYIPNTTINQETKITETNNIPAMNSNQINVGETPYTFNGSINFENNLGTTSELKNTNLDLFINNNQTTNTQLIAENNFDAAKVEILDTNINNLNIDNLNTNTTNIPGSGSEGDFTFDGNLFNQNNMPFLPEVNYSDNANVFGNFNFGGNNNIITNETNQDTNLNNMINNDINQINSTNNLNYEQSYGFSSNAPGEYFQTPDQNNQLINQFTFGEKEEITQPLNPINEFTENQNVYHELKNEQPKIENDILNLNANNNLSGNEPKENENVLNPNNNGDVIKDSLFPHIQESKTFIQKNENNNENNNEINNNPQEQKKENQIDMVPEVKISEKKSEEIKTIILPNEDNKNDNKNQVGNEVLLTNNITDNVNEPVKVEENKVENKLVDISDEIKEIREMPEKPFEQRDVIFNKNNIKVIKIEDDETNFCTGLLTPLFKKLFG